MPNTKAVGVAFSDPQFTGGVYLSGAGSLLFESFATGITAGTTRTQVGATVLTAEVNRVDTSTAPAAGSVLGDGVALPLPVAVGSSALLGGLDVTVINNTANIITVYPNIADAGATINGIAAATGIPIPPGDVAHFECTNVAGVSDWRVEAGVGTSGALPVQLVANGVSAAGANQAAATPLPADFNRITTATANQGVRLPAAVQGLDIVVSNKSGVPIIVYGNGTDTVDGIAGATGVSQMNNSVVFFFCTANGIWETEGLATGYAGNGLQTLQFTDAVAAAGTTQATATPLTAALNAVSSATANQGVNLPPISPGMMIVVENTTAVAIIVYPAQGASTTINGQSAAQGVIVQPGTVANFNATNSNNWVASPNSTNEAAFNALASATSLTLTGANITGGLASVDLSINGSQAGAITATLPTVANLVAAMHCPTVGSSYRLRVNNANTTQTITVATNTGWTTAAAPNNVLTIATATWREFVVTLTSLTAATLTSVATGTFS